MKNTARGEAQFGASKVAVARLTPIANARTTVAPAGAPTSTSPREAAALATAAIMNSVDSRGQKGVPSRGGSAGPAGSLSGGSLGSEFSSSRLPELAAVRPLDGEGGPDGHDAEEVDVDVEMESAVEVAADGVEWARAWPQAPTLPPSMLDMGQLLSGSGADENGRPRSPTSAIASAFSSLQGAHSALVAALNSSAALYDGLREAHGRVVDRARHHAGRRAAAVAQLAQVRARGKERKDSASAVPVTVPDPRLEESEAELAALRAAVANLRNAALVHASEEADAEQAAASLREQVLAQKQVSRSLGERMQALASEAARVGGLQERLTQAESENAALVLRVSAVEGAVQAAAEGRAAAEARAAEARRETAAAQASGREHAGEAAAVHAHLEAVQAELVKVEKEGTAARMRAVALVAQASAAVTAQAEMRRELAAERASVVKLQAVLNGKGCSRCATFDLPSVPPEEGAGGEREEYLAQLGGAPQHGPWYSVEAVRGALGDAAALRMVVLAPTVRISLALGGAGGAPPTPTELDLLAGVPLSALASTLQEEVLPRFAAVFATPRLRLKRPGGAPYPVPLPAGEEGGAVDEWLKAMVARMEDDVRGALDGSGLFANRPGGITVTTGSRLEAPSRR
jgi:hypothetical protein